MYAANLWSTGEFSTRNIEILVLIKSNHRTQLNQKKTSSSNGRKWISAEHTNCNDIFLPRSAIFEFLLPLLLVHDHLFLDAYRTKTVKPYIWLQTEPKCWKKNSNTKRVSHHTLFCVIRVSETTERKLGRERERERERVE